jgi:hypothetical protein
MVASSVRSCVQTLAHHLVLCRPTLPERGDNSGSNDRVWPGARRGRQNDVMGTARACAGLHRRPVLYSLWARDHERCDDRSQVVDVLLSLVDLRRAHSLLTGPAPFGDRARSNDPYDAVSFLSYSVMDRPRDVESLMWQCAARSGTITALCCDLLEQRNWEEPPRYGIIRRTATVHIDDISACAKLVLLRRLCQRGLVDSWALLVSAARSNRLDIANSMALQTPVCARGRMISCDCVGCVCGHAMTIEAASGGSTDVLDWIHANFDYCIVSSWIEAFHAALAENRIGCLDWFQHRYALRIAQL